jgi:hypothetical protein
MKIVTAINTKVVNTKFGAKDTFNITCDDGVNYSMGFSKPKFKVGDTINFVSEADKYGQKIDPATVQVITAGTGASVPTPAAGGMRSGGSGYSPRPFPIPPLHGDRSIVRQNALTNARELVTSIIGPDPDSHAEWAARQVQFEVLAAEVIRVARMFEDYTAGDIEARVAQEKE